MRARIHHKVPINQAIVLTKAIQRLAVELALSRQELSLIMGPSEATLSRLFKNDPKIKEHQNKYIDPYSKEGQLAILLVRLYRNLDVLFGGNSKQSQLWLRSKNAHLEKKTDRVDWVRRRARYCCSIPRCN